MVLFNNFVHKIETLKFYCVLYPAEHLMFTVKSIVLSECTYGTEWACVICIDSLVNHLYQTYVLWASE